VSFAGNLLYYRSGDKKHRTLLSGTKITCAQRDLGRIAATNTSGDHGPCKDLIIRGGHTFRPRRDRRGFAGSRAVGLCWWCIRLTGLRHAGEVLRLMSELVSGRRFTEPRLEFLQRARADARRAAQAQLTSMSERPENRRQNSSLTCRKNAHHSAYERKPGARGPRPLITDAIKKRGLVRAKSLERAGRSLAHAERYPRWSL